MSTNQHHPGSPDEKSDVPGGARTDRSNALADRARTARLGGGIQGWGPKLF
jgi:hypothetical protein